MIRPLQILLVIFCLSSCTQSNKKIAAKQIDISKKVDSNSKRSIPKEIDILEPDRDTLPNGKRLLDNIDLAMKQYYKEVVGTDTLKGGYITCYGIDDSTKYFYLRHGNNLRILNQTPIYTSTWSLGTLERDFQTFFITQIDNGNGCPSSYQLFDKKTGKNILGDGVVANCYTFFKDSLFVLYANTSWPIKTEKITLFNVQSQKKEFFKLPNALPEFCDIQINSITTNRLRLTFSNYGVGDHAEKTKAYSR